MDGPDGLHPLLQIDEFRWRIPKTGAMNVDGIIYGSRSIVADILKDKAAQQVMNVACLPGIVKASLAMPDAHWGYGFPIGGVAAFDAETGLVSPGGVGYDINCGVRLMATNLVANEVKDQLPRLAEYLFNKVPSGVGSSGSLKLKKAELLEVSREGSRWAQKNGFATDEDVENTEEGGRLEVLDVPALSERALERGKGQLGTLGSGNHFLELQVVDQIFDEDAAQTFGAFEGQLMVMLHSGSRGFGYQVCDDFLKVIAREAVKSGVSLPDRQLAYAALGTKTATEYLDAMACAANYAWANRQVMMHITREVMAQYFGSSPAKLGLRLVYDVCHNIAKFENHLVNGKKQKLLVHRKGATRAFGPGRAEVPQRYRKTGQPVLIPGDMGRASYVLKGTQTAMDETFGSSCHGAGRLMSRTAAEKTKTSAKVREELNRKGIAVFSADPRTLAEEMPEAYKNVEDVVASVHGAGLAEKVFRLRPLAVIKG